MIFNKQPIDVLYDIVKGVGLPVYKHLMKEEAKQIPKNYILIRADITNSNRFQGDGKCLVRASDCDITLISKGAATNTTDVHNQKIAQIEERLQHLEINYSKVNLGYDKELMNTQCNFAITINYYG